MEKLKRCPHRDMSSMRHHEVAMMFLFFIFILSFIIDEKFSHTVLVMLFFPS